MSSQNLLQEAFVVKNNIKITKTNGTPEERVDGRMHLRSVDALIAENLKSGFIESFNNHQANILC